MTESLEDILKNGYGVWKKNFILCLPPLLSTIISLVLMGIAVLICLFVFIGAFSTFLKSSGESLAAGSLPNLSNFLPIIILIFLGIVVFTIILGFISAFFDAGAIGMSKEANLKGKTTFDDMVAYGKKKFVSMFFASIIVGLIIFGGLALIFFVFIGIPYIAGMFSSGNLGAGILLAIIGIILAFIYLLITALIFSPMKYALVVSDLGAIEGVKKGYDFFMKNKLHVFLLLLIIILIVVAVFGISAIIRLPLRFLGVFGLILSLLISLITFVIFVLILSPLTTVWWTRFYLDRTATKKTRSKVRI